MQGAFNLLTFSDPDGLPLLYIQYQTRALHIENPDQVKEARLAFDQLQAKALSPADSVALIERLAVEADQWTTPD